MLQNIHDKAKGWVAYLIIFLISIPFALFGINSYLGGGGNRIVAEINGEEIQASVINAELLQIKQQFAQLAGLDDKMLKQMALDRVVSRTLLEQEVRQHNYRVSNADVLKEITQIEAFHKEGKFDKEQYQQVLSSNRRNEGLFEEQVRNDLAQGQFQSLVSSTAFVPKEVATQYQALKNQQRNIDTFSLKMADFTAQVQVTEAQIQDYYEKNKARYMTAEQVKLAYIELKRSDFEQSLTPSVEELGDFYNSNKDRYVIPEKRQASHIVIAIASPEQDVAAKQKAETLAAEISAGTRSFEQVAQTDSADGVSAKNGGDLGLIAATDWDKAFNDAVFALKSGEVSPVTKTAAGYEIIKLTKLEATIQKTFELAKADVEKDFRSEQASEMFQDKDDELPTLAYENENDLAPIAAALHLKVQNSDWISRDKGEGIGQLPQVREIAFSETVKKGGRNSEKLDIADGHALVVRLLEQKPASQKPLASVKAEISQTLQTQQTRQLIISKGEALLAKLKTTQNWNALTELALGSIDQVNKLGLISRSDKKADAQILSTAFAMNTPAAGKYEYNNVISPNGDYNIIALSAVQAGTTKVDNTVQQGFGLHVAQREQGALLQALREQAEIILYPENL
jgi:peptidyl-prolyl cis-trans isomerase D